ncbi:peroxide stress protein YaaA [Bordetella avium]|uniref:peroxide stress protein YaaA n=1 Tax=Bordetella avium TaxID=521 RepID=UPI000E0ACAA3|nr:peroxide stress protein YaaA [Bordetella avium]RIQ13181.1 peroxide stress protein YaaA [Bordetella avium]RIQ37592.1 peroxide stress protein YaaA [Bordetella avium]RIQ42390.1 peroxide stress protein YaaA [Bordetella avium]RIQ42729.1 peroxide stress protein YaaA [Bordetella avium]RIQ49192.1 peroxide stress protein YaaA [Bordetella avium]
MLFLLSPAKKLDYDTPVQVQTHTQPLFVEQAAALIKVLKTKSADEIAGLMSLSQALAELNVGRYAAWKKTFTLDNARQAVLAFNGDVYEGLEATSLSASQLDWAQEHVVILSGLYGALRPLDLMQPYRLEMGTRLETPKGKNLYEYWGSTIAAYLNERQEGEGAPCIINLASEEYFKAVDLKTLKARVVQCVFQDWKGGAWKIISFHAKRARGLMVRYAIEHRAKTPEALQAFDREGYVFDASASSADKLVFRRRLD